MSAMIQTGDPGQRMRLGCEPHHFANQQISVGFRKNLINLYLLCRSKFARGHPGPLRARTRGRSQMRWLSALVLASAWLLLPSSGRAETPTEPAATAPQEAAAPSAGAPLGTAPLGTAPGPTEEAKIEGFRSAVFGMTEAQVRQAIRKDFAGPSEKI